MPSYVMLKLPLAATLPNYLRSLPPNIYSAAELSQVIKDYAQAINTPLNAQPEAFITHYIKDGKIRVIELVGVKGNLQRYAFHEPSPLEVGLHIKSGAYFSHGTAAWLHSLINEEPSAYHLSIEVPESSSKGDKLQQKAIDKAFNKEQRKSSAIYQWRDFRFLLLNGLDTGTLGIDKKAGLPLTSIERTLLDLTVRPTYAGGAKMVLQAYRKALPHASIKILIKMLDKINFIYPFHQSIGFYLSRAGYTGSELKQLSHRPRPFHFYLDYAMKEPHYANEWNIYYPNDL